MKRVNRRSNRQIARSLKRRIVLELERMEDRRLLAFVVTSIASSGANTLAAAITISNATPSTPANPNIIQFNITGTGQHTINLTSALPTVSQPVAIEGYTQLGSSPASPSTTATITIIVNGGDGGFDGLNFAATANGSSVSGLDLIGFGTSRAIKDNANALAVTGNYIGVGPDGLATLATTNSVGVDLLGVNAVTIGGTTPASRNVITGNTTGAVLLQANGLVGSSANLIEGNYIGISAAGTLAGTPAPALRNGVGVQIDDGSGNTIGGTVAVTGNVISGNDNGATGAGIAINGVTASANFVESNTIGLDAAAAVAVPNATGIELHNTLNNTIGGAGVGNVIAGNTAAGITILQDTAGTTDGDVILSNLIGTTPAGLSGVGNGSDGIIVTGAAQVTIGGTATGASNVISGNIGYGVNLQAASLVQVTANTIGLSSISITALPNESGGVFAKSSTSITLTNDTISGNTGNGFAATSTTGVVLAGGLIQSNTGSGLVLTSSTGASISGATIGGIGLLGNSLAGISLVSSPNATLGGTVSGAGLVVSGGGKDGIDFDAASGSGQVLDSTVSNNAGLGISVLSSELLTGDTVQSNTLGGVLVSGAAGTTITSSTIGGTASPGPGGNGLFGVSVVGSANVTIGGATPSAGVKVEDNLATGIVFSAASNGGRVIDSTIIGNAGDGLDVINSTGAVLTGDTIQSNTINGVLITGSSGTTLTSSLIGGITVGQGNGGDGVLVHNSINVRIGGAGPLAVLIAGNVGVGISTDSTLALTGITIQGNQAAGLIFSGVPGSSILSSTIGGLTAGQGNGGVGILVTGSANVSIGGVAAGSGVLVAGNSAAGIVFNTASNAGQVLGSTISGNGAVGIEAINSTGLLVNGDTIQTNLGGGIYLSNAGGALITDDTIGGFAINLGNEGFGVSVVGSANVTIGGIASGAGDVVVDNQGVGIAIDPSNNPDIINATIAGNAGDGIDIVGSTGAIFIGDTIFTNQGGGILLSNAGGASITSSTIGGSTAGLGNGSFGVSVLGSADATIGGTTSGAGVLVASNQGLGISFSGSSRGTLVNDSIQSNAVGGLLLLNSPAASLTSSTIGGTAAGQGNIGFGVSVSGSSNVVVGGIGGVGVLIESNQGVGLSFLSSDSNSTIDSIISGNFGDGVDVLFSAGSTLSGDTIQNSTGGGLRATGGSNLAVQSSTIGGPVAGQGNGAFGLSVSGTSNVVISGGFLVAGNLGVGISLDQAFNGSISGGTVTGNSGVGIISHGGNTNMSDLVVQANFLGGVSVQNSNGFTINSSTIGGTTSSLGNGLFGLSVDGSQSAILGGTTASLGLLIHNNAGVGVSLTNLSTVLLEGSTVSSNTGVGLAVSNSQLLTLSYDTISTNTGGGVSLASSLTASISDFTVTSNGGFGINVQGSNGLTIGSVLVAGNSGIGVSITNSTAPVLSNGTVQSNAGGVLLSGDDNASLTTLLIGGLTAGQGNNGFGVSVSGSSNVTIGGTAANAGVQVTGNSGVGVALANSNFASIIDDVFDQNHGNGLDVAGSSSLMATGSYFSMNGAGGLALVSSPSAVISKTALVSNGSFGIQATNSNALQFLNSASIGNVGTGVNVVGSSGLIVTGTTIETNQSGGVVLTNSAQAQFAYTVVGSAGLGNGVVGLSLANSPNATLGGTATGSGLTVEGNIGDGIALSSSPGALVEGSSLVNNTGFGIKLVNGSDQGTITNDIVNGNQGVGIAIDGSAIPAIVGDSVALNRSGGITLNAVMGGAFIESSTIGGTTADQANGLVGVSIANSPNVRFGASLVRFNSGDGVDLNGSSNVQLGDLMVLNNANIGINAFGSSGLMVARDTVQRNGGDGVILNGSNGSQITNSQVTDNSGNGVSIASSSVTVSISTIQTNSGAGIQLVGASSSNTTIVNAIDSGNKSFGLIILNSANNIIGMPGAPDTFDNNGSSGLEIIGSSRNTIQADIIMSNAVDGIVLDAGSSFNTIGGTTSAAANVISLNVQTGVQISNGSDSNSILSDRIGTDLSGTVDEGNLGNGVSIVDASSNDVGPGNVISANKQSGVQIVGIDPAGVTNKVGNAIISDLIGTDLTGKVGLPNLADGVSIILASYTNIGTPGAGNTISANGSDGISIESASALNIVGNKIGTTSDGSTALGNGNEGIYANHSNANQIGQVGPGGDNTVSANPGGQIEIANSQDNLLMNNEIGTNELGTSLVLPTTLSANGQYFGVFLNESSNNTIGSLAIGAGNIISSPNITTNFGLQIFGPGSTGNRIQGNEIGTTRDKTQSLGNYVGVFINSAPSNIISQNTLGGSVEAEILVSGDSATNNVIGGTVQGAGNTINGTLPIASGAATLSGAKPTGVLILAVKGTVVGDNTITGETVGIESFGTPNGTTIPISRINQDPIVTTIENNTLHDNLYGIFIDGSALNQVTGNTVQNNTGVNNILAVPNSELKNYYRTGIYVNGPQSAGNIIENNMLSESLYGVYLANAPYNTIDTNIVSTQATGGTGNPQHDQAGIYLFGQFAQKNDVSSNVISNIDGYGIVFLNTPQQASLANTFNANQFRSLGTATIPLRTDAIDNNIQPLPDTTKNLPMVPPPPPSVKTSSVHLTKIVGKASKAFSARKSMFAHLSKVARAGKASH